MPTSKKIQLVKSLTDKFQKSKAVYLLDYQGLTHQQLETLRLELGKVNAQLVIVKNRLFLRALNTLHPDIASDLELKGPTAVLFSNEDEITPLSIVKRSAREHKLPQFKLGFLAQKLLKLSEVERLAKIPSKKFIQSQVVTSLASPITNLLFVLQANQRKLLFILTKLSKTKH